MAVHRIRVSELLATFAPAYLGTDWATVVTAMLAEPSHREIVDQLRAALALNGRFAEPVVVDRDDQTICNGMHRVVAAILNDHEEIDVSDDYCDDDTEDIEITFSMTVADPDPMAALDFATAWLTSFALADRWVNADVLAGDAASMTGYWYWPQERLGELCDALVQRSAARGVEVTILSAQVANTEA